MKKGTRIVRVLSIILSLLTLFLIAPLLLGYIPVGTRENLMTTARTTSLPAAAEAASPDNPREQFERAKKAYHDPQFSGKGKYADFWKPVPIQQYWDPINFYSPPETVKGVFDAQDCIKCHEDGTPGFYQGWKKSYHARISEIRRLKPTDKLYHKRQILQEVEQNLRSQGLLGKGEELKEVSCIHCHGGVGIKKLDHFKELRLPDRASCGVCHLKEFTQAESEKEQKWPQGQWPDGRPSHALDYRANVDTAVWAGMPQRSIAQGCDQCHYDQNKCDGCHTRHTFSTVEARKPEACATCHNGVDHNEFENFMLSKHGVVYATLGDKRDWQTPLKDAISKGGYTSPTCAFCHFEYNGEFSHNLVRKVRWAFNPTPSIARNLGHEWFTKRQDSWIDTCTNCHSNRFAESYLKAADQAILAGLDKEQEAKKVVQALYDEGLLVGQKTNRPQPPSPEADAPGGFFQLFWAEGNNPSAIEMEYAEMWEHDLIQLYKGATHMNPGGYTYSHGWSPLLGRYARIMDENTKLREMAALKEQLASHEGRMKAVRWGVSGLGLLLVGGLLLYRGTRKD